eukprot:TRINITY_DN20364_c0_g1_i1.p1 TRINITY_DN20364_c0_g1~~TRINITY_DN20364_c0_g1_i1.p1  ORF type:complete len:408 (-),score=58.97 TRINITY_DN20364_c0_g1_i1:427-1650(-)
MQSKLVGMACVVTSQPLFRTSAALYYSESSDRRRISRGCIARAYTNSGLTSSSSHSPFCISEQASCSGKSPCPIFKSKSAGLSNSCTRPLRLCAIRRGKHNAGHRLEIHSLAAQRTVPELNEGIANFYDSSSGLWEDMWGEHMHHGFYEKNTSFNDMKDHQQAQIDMIEKVLAWAGAEDGEKTPKNVVDVGCGIGGSSRHISRKYGAKVTGITLSPVQAQRATTITAERGLSDKVSFQVADALNQPFADGAFDLVWSLESGEHMPDKRQFMGELARVTAPGGRIIVVTWCHRNLALGETALAASEQELLDRICDAYYLPAWCSPDEYTRIAQELGLEDVRTDDWSANVTPFWPAVIASALSFKGVLGLARSGLTTLRGALAMALMVQGFNRGVVKFALITGRKPTQA